jgi:hypothetical protein
MARRGKCRSGRASAHNARVPQPFVNTLTVQWKLYG